MSCRPESRQAATDIMNNIVPTSSLPSMFLCAMSLAIKHSLMFSFCVLRGEVGCVCPSSSVGALCVVGWGVCVPVAVLGHCVL